VTELSHPETTSVYLKTSQKMVWPNASFFYLLTANGLFLCRNHPFFRSCTAARNWPSILATQHVFLAPNYPKMPRLMIEQIVGFFAAVAALHRAEAGVLLAWDTAAEQLHIVVPQQRATVACTDSGDQYPIGLEYETPTDLPASWTIVGDVHSHVHAGPTPSTIDNDDETYRAGLHIVVGRLNLEPPDFHAEAVVDGTRFRLKLDHVMESYQRRAANAPADWLQKVSVKVDNISNNDNNKEQAHGES